jgi:hypothetical protein
MEIVMVIFWRLKVVVEGGYGGDVVVMEVVEAFGYGGS